MNRYEVRIGAHSKRRREVIPTYPLTFFEKVAALFTEDVEGEGKMSRDEFVRRVYSAPFDPETYPSKLLEFLLKQLSLAGFDLKIEEQNGQEKLVLDWINDFERIEDHQVFERVVRLINAIAFFKDKSGKKQVTHSYMVKQYALPVIAEIVEKSPFFSQLMRGVTNGSNGETVLEHTINGVMAKIMFSDAEDQGFLHGINRDKLHKMVLAVWIAGFFHDTGKALLGVSEDKNAAMSGDGRLGLIQGDFAQLHAFTSVMFFDAWLRKLEPTTKNDLGLTEEIIEMIRQLIRFHHVFEQIDKQVISHQEARQLIGEEILPPLIVLTSADAIGSSDWHKIFALDNLRIATELASNGSVNEDMARLLASRVITLLFAYKEIIAKRQGGNKELLEKMISTLNEIKQLIIDFLSQYTCPFLQMILSNIENEQIPTTYSSVEIQIFPAR